MMSKSSGMVSLNNGTWRLIKVNENDRQLTGQQPVIRHAVQVFLDKHSIFNNLPGAMYVCDLNKVISNTYPNT
jgi:hypothetical protein